MYVKLNKKDKAFRTNKISYLDFKLIEMDRVLTNLFARLKHNGAPSKLGAKSMTLALYRDEFLDPKNKHWFKSFALGMHTLRVLQCMEHLIFSTTLDNVGASGFGE